MSTLSNACYTMGKGLLFNLNRTSCQLYHGVNRFLFYIDEVRSIPDQHGEHNFYSDSCRHVNLVGRHYHDTYPAMQFSDSAVYFLIYSLTFLLGDYYPRSKPLFYAFVANTGEL